MSNFSAQKLPRRISGLNELSQNIWWSWHPAARYIFKALDRPAWKASLHNPVMLLQKIAPYRLIAAAEDTEYLKVYDSVIGDFRSELSAEKLRAVSPAGLYRAKPSPIFQWNLLCTVPSLSMPEGWECWPVTIVKKPAIWVCP